MLANVSVRSRAAAVALVCLALGTWASFWLPDLSDDDELGRPIPPRPDLTHAADKATEKSVPKAPEGPPPLTVPFVAKRAKESQEAWAQHLGKPGPVEENSIGMELVLIPPGSFTMGSPPAEEGRLDNERPVAVTLTKAFYLGKTEVTQGQWRAVIGTTPWTGRDCVREGDNYAATYVSWGDAQAFCKKLSETENAKYRLPTEAEWEYACRAGTATRFSTPDEGSDLNDYAWWGGILDEGSAKDEKYAHEVGQKRENLFGLHDMHGNVWEWCLDQWVNIHPGGTDPLASENNMVGVCRGGGWNNYATRCRSAFRKRIVRHHDYLPGSRHSYLGFRVVRESGQSVKK
ncbi:MAG: hypothetical protein JWN70_3706 [Planctomycetaceae bacterium]|nr:hypothetical protein [Planctomycetaceae bacterium]